MIWTLLFFASIAQGFFLITLLWLRRSTNLLATALLIAVVFVMLVINADYLLTTSEIYRQYSSLYGMSFSSMLVMGPLVYLYTRSIMDDSFVWQWKHFIHFIPFLIKFIHGLKFITLPTNIKIAVIDAFLAQQAYLTRFAIVIISLQVLHMCIYLYFTRKIITLKMNGYLETPFLISFQQRSRWVNTLFLCFVLLLIVFVLWFAVVMYLGHYLSIADYTNALLTSLIIYFIAYNTVLNPDLINPDFQRKSQASPPIPAGDKIHLQQKLNSLMEEKRFFLKPDVDLNSLSKELDLPVYLCSKLINDTSGKGFFDFINTYRIQEVKKRLTDPAFNHYSILGIALETGFNSKSSFNLAFKKITGMTPKEYRKSPVLTK